MIKLGRQIYGLVTSVLNEGKHLPPKPLLNSQRSQGHPLKLLRETYRDVETWSCSNQQKVQFFGQPLASSEGEGWAPIKEHHYASQYVQKRSSC